IGQVTNGNSSIVDTPTYFSALADALATSSGGDVLGPQARHVRISINAQVPLLFWSFIPLVTDRRVNVFATAVAGISAPLCQACGIEPYAVAALDPTDPIDFGFTADTKYSFTYLCNGTRPGLLAPGTAILTYILLNRQDDTAAIYPDPA